MTNQVLDLLNERAEQLHCKDWEEYRDDVVTAEDSDTTFECLYSIIDNLLNENKELQRKIDYVLKNS